MDDLKFHYGMETKESANKKYNIIGEKESGNTTKEFEVEVPAEIFSSYRKTSIAKISSRIEIPGFRKGHSPESVLVQKLGEMTILEEAAEETVNEITPLILAEKKVNFVSQPEISITAIAPGNPLRFKIKVYHLPEIILADYKKIAAGKNQVVEKISEPTEKELNDAIEQIRKIAAKQLGLEKDKLPELDDTFAKRLGNFKTVSELKDKLKSDMIKEKEVRAKEKKRIDISEAIIAETKIDLPDPVVDYELDKMASQFEGDLENMQMKLEDYLSKTKKSMTDLKKDWRPDAEKRAKLELIIYKIAAAEKIAPSESEIKKETDHLMEHHKDVQRDAAQRYIEKALINRKVFEFLESCSV